MPFLVTVEARDLGHVFPSPTVSTSGRDRASIFSTLVPLLIQTSMLFFLSPIPLVRGLAASSRRGVRRLWCQRRQGFFDKLFLTIVFLPPLFYLSFYQLSETFAEELNKVGFFWSSLLIEFLENGLEVVKVRGSVLYFFLLKLRVMFESVSGRVDEDLGDNEILSKKSLEIDPG